VYDRYTRPTGAGQYAPGRDLPALGDDSQFPQRKRPQGPDINAAVLGSGVPVGGAATPFQGAQQTTQPVGPKVEQPPAASPIDALGGAQPPGTSPAAAPPPKTFQTNLMEGDPNKLADKAHAAESPKYDFLQLANQNKYNYDQMPDMLKELQGGPNGRLWQGWGADGKGNFVFQGDPSQLAPEWKGVKRVDAVGAFGDFANGWQSQRLALGCGRPQWCWFPDGQSVGDSERCSGHGLPHCAADGEW
jgi:hypothetical protein